MSFVEHDHMIETFATNGTDDSFAIRILPRRPGRDQDFVDSQALDAFLEIVAVDTVAIANEKTWGFFVQKRVDNLLGGQRGSPVRPKPGEPHPEDAVTERDLRPIAAEPDWQTQRQMWAGLANRLAVGR